MSGFKQDVEELKPQNFFANFSALLPSGNKAVHVQFVTTLVGSSFLVGPNAYADSITTAIISYNRDDSGEFVVRVGEGTTYGSISDPFDLYTGRKRAFARALDTVTDNGQAEILAKLHEERMEPSTIEERFEAILRLGENFTVADKRMRAFMWDKFLKFFPTPESV